MNNLLCLALVVVCLPIAFNDLSSQTIKPQPEKDAAKEYSDETAVVVKDDVVYRYAADGTGVKTETAVVRVQSGAALQTFAVLGFPYASGTQSLEITYTRVRKSDGQSWRRQ